MEGVASDFASSSRYDIVVSVQMLVFYIFLHITYYIFLYIICHSCFIMLNERFDRMPPLKYATPEIEAARRLRYERQLKERSEYQPAHKQLPIFMALQAKEMFPKGTVRSSQTMMTHFVNVTDCDMFG